MAGKHDMGASAFILKQSRAEVVDYLPTLMESYQQIFIRNPAEQLDWEVYTLPYSWMSWVDCSVWFFAAPLIMVIVMYECKYKILR